jgi:hypothetical protein
MHCRHDGFNPNPIIDRRPDALPGSEVLLGGLNRDVAQAEAGSDPTRHPHSGRAERRFVANRAAQVQEYLLLSLNTSLRARSLFR